MRGLAVLLLCCSPVFARDEPIRVAAAISLKDALTDVIAKYEAESGQRVTLTIGSSGQLMAQIKSGAPIDVFISAAPQQVVELSKEGLIEDATRRVVARNRLVLIVPHDSSDPPESLEQIASEKVVKLAIGEPKTVPAGMYAQQMIEKLKLTDTLRGKLVYGTNVRQVLDYVIRGEVSAGIVYATDASEAGTKVRVVATVDESLHDPIEYPAVLVKRSRDPTNARRFVEFLISEAAQAEFARRGFAAPTTSPAAR